MNVSNAGAGNSRFVFSGSATVVAGNSTSDANSIWLGPPNLLSGGSGFGAIVSGSGYVTVGSVTADVSDVFAGSFGFAPRAGFYSFTTGTALSWSGDIIASHDFSNFTQGTFSTNFLGNVGLGRTGYTIDSLYVLTVGSAAVPAPATLALFGLGLAGLGWKRRKQA